MTLVFDSNIVIDLLEGREEARSRVYSDEDRVVSIITWTEVLAGCRTEPEERLARRVLTGFREIHIGPEIAESTVMIRRERRIKLPDSIVLATARFARAQLVTRNTRDFPSSDPEIVVPYV